MIPKTSMSLNKCSFKILKNVINSSIPKNANIYQVIIKNELSINTKYSINFFENLNNDNKIHLKFNESIKSELLNKKNFNRKYNSYTKNNLQTSFKIDFPKKLNSYCKILYNQTTITKSLNQIQKSNFTSKTPFNKTSNISNSYYSKNKINDVNQFNSYTNNGNTYPNNFKTFYKRVSSKKNTQNNQKRKFNKSKYQSSKNKSHTSSKKFVTDYFVIPIGGTITIKLLYHYGQKLREENISKCSTIYCEAHHRNKDGRGKNIVIALEEKKNNENTEDKQKEQENKELLKFLFSIIKKDLLLVLFIFAVTLSAAGINVLTPIITGDLINVVQDVLKRQEGFYSIDFAEFTAPTLKLLTLYLTQGILTFVDITLVAKLGENIASRLKLKLFNSYLLQEISFFDKNKYNDIITRLTNDINSFKSTFKQALTQGLKCTTQVVISASYLISISPSLTLTICSTMPIIYFSMNLYGIYLRKLSKKAHMLEDITNFIASEAISNIRTVRSFAAEPTEMKLYQSSLNKTSDANTKLGFHIGIFQGTTNASIGSLVLMILYFGGKQVVQGSMNPGQLMTYMVAMQNTQKSLSHIGVLFGQSIKAFDSLRRVYEYVTDSEGNSSNANIIINEIQDKIEFKNVNFTYPTRPEAKILNNFSLKIPVGKVLAICGTSGSGKSTIGQLIEKFYEIDSGNILVDDISIKDIDSRSLRKNIGYINQEPILFHTTILENIRYGNPNATLEEVKEAARQANASHFVESFPKGYDTIVGDRGVALSGGQKQRIAIARAILKNPSILILDEATSALDSHSERIVQEALNRLMKGRTVIVIAHRLSTIKNADNIIVMKPYDPLDGEKINIIESGTHRSLMRKKGEYYKFYKDLSRKDKKD
ncbi:hypothetical protein BCR36DRAFT_415069 [Piromyces finnis]|uniref:Mitochondrial potassium channel ATP-binding subunit n=1 Tax=Piromyces finnis TaxID=1754191 RepID=A0A1Y1UZY2_9FUNG|nr:hypothetical protein BCR36DRAFT_415069 [Piromyces finnis]|eukprot:ORX44313.1 hypothetical protein BCR36DRAFT_415069 [Piromyces finnis]